MPEKGRSTCCAGVPPATVCYGIALAAAWAGKGDRLSVAALTGLTPPLV